MKIQFVLVEPKVPENIGASARAIKTMGFSKLVLVNPCNWMEGKSKWVAHGSGEILENAVTFSTLKDAVKDSDFIIATSSKQRTVMHDYVPIRVLPGLLNDKSDSIEIVSLVFGREESGLTNDEIKLCDVTSTISMACSYPSLNLSQAVMICAYEIAGLNLNNLRTSKMTDHNSGKNLKIKIREILQQLGINERDNIYGRLMERISFLNDDDINLAHSVSNLLLEITGKK
jgi:tRNA/rRNA methyltransferase